MRRTACSIALVMILGACKKDEAPAASADPAAAGGGAEAVAAAKPTGGSGGTEIPNIDGLVADPPAGAVPNALTGAAGFHADDGSVDLTVMETSAEEAAKTMDAIKEESIDAKNWITAEATADGFKLVWEAVKITLTEEGEPKEDGTLFAYHVRRKIGDKTYTCYGRIPKQDGIEAHLKACASVRAK